MVMTGCSLLILTLTKFFRFYDLSLRPTVSEEEDVLIDDSNEDADPGPSGNADQERNSNCVSRAQLKVYDIIC